MAESRSLNGPALPGVERLSAQHRKCLRLYHRRFRAKEIAAELGGISVNTVNGYLSEASAILNCGGRAAAAAALAAYEAAHPNLTGHELAGEPITNPLPAPRQAAWTPPPGVAWRHLLPLRQGAIGNDLSLVLRVFWILGIAIAVAIGFGMLAVGIRVLSDLAA